MFTIHNTYLHACICLCTLECPLPNLHDFVEIANETINGTVLGSNIHLRCTHDLSLSTNLQPATCTKDGEWIPNPEKYTCQAKGKLKKCRV